MKFTEKEKIDLFDKLEKLYFDRNFGSTSKADLDVLLFSTYIEHCMDAGEPYDDYTLSKSLGITQARIRTLKEKKELKYPRTGFKWEEVFAQAVKTAKYDKNDHYVKMIIQDINVMNEVRHFIEQKGWYDECALNKRLLRIPLDCFVEICSCDEEFYDVFSEEAKQRIKKMKYEESAFLKFVDDFSMEGLKEFLMSASKDVVCAILKELPFSMGGIAGTAFRLLIQVIERE